LIINFYDLLSIHQVPTVAPSLQPTLKPTYVPTGLIFLMLLLIIIINHQFLVYVDGPFVRIDRTQQFEHLINLQEVELYVDNVKLIGLTASFSQAWASDVDASNCVDGSTTGQICHSRGADPWLVINLHGQAVPDHIKVYNAGSDRILGARISICNDFDCSSNPVWSGTFLTSQLVFDFDTKLSPSTFTPTLMPTIKPTVAPTIAPTVAPTTFPTSPAPTISPTFHPSLRPTFKPSRLPSLLPTILTLKPSSYSPTVVPTEMNGISAYYVQLKFTSDNMLITDRVYYNNDQYRPTRSPTSKPTPTPKPKPTNAPTVVPSPVPTLQPTLTSYVKIVQHNNFINLIEVELYSNNMKVPLSALTATQSSTITSDYPASICIDGRTSCPNSRCVLYASGSPDISYICHTDRGPNEWLLVTATGYDVNKVIVYNRLESWTDGLRRINGATILVSHDDTFTSIVYQESFGDSASAVYTFDLPTNTLSIAAQH